MSKVLVTGADGFIGSHLAEALVRAGHDVRALVFYNSFGSRGWLDHADPALVRGMEIIGGDVRDGSAMRSLVQGRDVVMHLAALIAIPFSYRAPESYVDTNVKGTLNVLQAARDLGCGLVVQTSTSEVYGTASYVPIDETHPLNAQSPYAATKVAADQLALSFHRSFGLPVSVIRPFNTYGPRQSTRAVIPTIITQLVAGQRRLRLGALRPTRDFSFVMDTVAAFVRAIDAPAAVGTVVNAGSGFEISIGDTARLIAELMGIAAEIEEDKARLRPAESEVDRLFASTDRAREVLGWAPAYGGLDGFRRGLGETIAWFSDPANLVHYRTREYTL